MFMFIPTFFSPSFYLFLPFLYVFIKFVRCIPRDYYEPSTELETEDTKINKAYHAPSSISQGSVRVRHVIF